MAKHLERMQEWTWFLQSGHVHNLIGFDGRDSMMIVDLRALH
jgi:hypothetical protein